MVVVVVDAAMRNVAELALLAAATWAPRAIGALAALCSDWAATRGLAGEE